MLKPQPRKRVGDVMRGAFTCPMCRKNVARLVYIGHRDSRGVHACEDCASKLFGIEAQCSQS